MPRIQLTRSHRLLLRLLLVYVVLMLGLILYKFVQVLGQA